MRFLAFLGAATFCFATQALTFFADETKKPPEKVPQKQGEKKAEKASSEKAPEKSDPSKGKSADRKAPRGKPVKVLSTKPILLALGWLARHQGSGGGWSTANFNQRCPESDHCLGKGRTDHDVGLTGLSVLAFLRAGHLPGSASELEVPGREKGEVRPGDVVRAGLRSLIAGQEETGAFPKNMKAGEKMYDHAIATIAMVEAADFAGEEEYKASARKAVGYILMSQNPGLGWRYIPEEKDNDTSVTVWCVLALRAAETTGLTVNPEAFRGALTWLRRVTDPRSGSVGYFTPGDGGSVITGVNDEWETREAMTAAGMEIHLCADRSRTDPWFRKAIDLMQKCPPRWEGDHRAVDFYYWSHAVRGLLILEGPSGKNWKSFSKAVKSVLETHQAAAKDGCSAGSWDPAADKWGSIGGRVYATALNVLTLELIEGTRL